MWGFLRSSWRAKVMSYSFIHCLVHCCTLSSAHWLAPSLTLPGSVVNVCCTHPGIVVRVWLEFECRMPEISDKW